MKATQFSYGTHLAVFVTVL
jgi:hypothetical protein